MYRGVSIVRDSLWAELVARLVLTLLVLAPYSALLGFDVLVVTDDGFTSDIWNGELPVRALSAETFRREGVLPSWTSELCSGSPLAGSSEPLSLAAFTALPLAAALDAALLTWILIAAHGAYSLARRVGATRAGSVLAGVAFGASGYLVCHLKQLSVLGTVVWLPLGLSLLDRALRVAGSESVRVPERLVYLALFGLVFGLQVLAGFPQSAYVCALAYGVHALYCVAANPQPAHAHPLRRFAPLLPALLVTCLGALVGALALLPLLELGSLSDRAGGGGFAWATKTNYLPKHALMFLLPYAFGDVSDGSYEGGAIFWEDYAYVGLATLPLALYAAVRERRRGVTWLFLGLGVGAYLLVLGPATPLFELAFELLPGMSLFRFPMRFLVVVDLCLCILAALGTSRLADDLRPLLARARAERMQPAVVATLVLGTALDLFNHQPRQIATVPAEPWLAPPATVRALHDDSPAPRVFSPFHMDFHRAAFRAARGWADLRPYYLLRDVLQPNSNLYWNVASADCYGGIAPRWHVDVWGDHNRTSELVYPALGAEPGRLLVTPVFITLMRTYGVTHLISPFAVPALESVPQAGAAGGTRVYRVPGAARVRIAERALHATDTKSAVKLLSDPSFDPDLSVVLHEAEGAPAPATPPAGASPSSALDAASIERDGREQLVVRARAPRGGYLVLADTFYPGWRAEVDGQPTPIHRANLSLRAVPLLPGEHRVVFRYEPSWLALGRGVSLGALAALLALLVGALAWRKRAARQVS